MPADASYAGITGGCRTSSSLPSFRIPLPEILVLAIRLLKVERNCLTLFLTLNHSDPNSNELYINIIDQQSVLFYWHILAGCSTTLRSLVDDKRGLILSLRAKHNIPSLLLSCDTEKFCTWK